MIAPRKKKLIKRFIMAWSVVLVITGSALPVFASPATDDQGNLSPSSYYVQWSIYNTSTDSYDNVGVTSSVSVDGLTFIFPYNTTGVNRLVMQLYGVDNGVFYLDSLSFSGYVSYTSNVSNSTYLVNFSSSSAYQLLDANNSSLGTNSLLKNNPFTSDASGISSFVRSIRFFFYPNEVSGYFTVHFDSLVLNGVDIKSQVYVSNLEDSTEDLDDSVEALETALPLPTFDASAFASAEAIADDYTFFNDGLRFSFMESDLVTHIFILVVYFTCLSIAIFGHAGG